MRRNELISSRLQSSYLDGRQMAAPVDVVRWFGCVQAQDYTGAKWGLGQRCSGVSESDIDTLFNDGCILRTHIMRPTWHFVLPEDIRWIQELTSRNVHRMMASYNKKLELDAGLFRKTDRLIAQALAGENYLTRQELKTVLHRHGITGDVQRYAHIVSHAELESLIVSGPLRGKQQTYALLAERAPQGNTFRGDEALGELTRRYFTSHGPAQATDFGWWSGLSMAEAKRGIELCRPALQSDSLDGKTVWFYPAQSPPGRQGPQFHLLPNYDEFLVAYRDHSFSLDPELLKLPQQRITALLWGGHFMVRGGQIVGTWKRIAGKQVQLTAIPHVTLTAAERRAFGTCFRSLRDFIGGAVLPY